MRRSRKFYSYKILAFCLVLCSCHPSEEGCRLYMQTVCIDFKGVVIKKGEERYRTLRFETNKGKVKLPMPSWNLWDNIEVGDSLYKIGGSNRCRVITLDKRSLDFSYADENTYSEQSRWCGDCDSNPLYKTDNPNPYNTR